MPASPQPTPCRMQTASRLWIWNYLTLDYSKCFSRTCTNPTPRAVSIGSTWSGMLTRAQHTLISSNSIHHDHLRVRPSYETPRLSLRLACRLCSVPFEAALIERSWVFLFGVFFINSGSAPGDVNSPSDPSDVRMECKPQEL